MSDKSKKSSYSGSSWAAYLKKYSAVRRLRVKHGATKFYRLLALDDPDLMDWIKYNQSNLDKLSIEQFVKLCTSKFDFGRIRTWPKFFLMLVKYEKKHGHCMLTEDDKDKRLYKWTLLQRNKWFQTSKDKKKLLLDIGFEPDKHKVLWFKYYNEIKAFKKSNKHMRVKYADDGLFQWCQRQRREYRKEILSEERITLLEKIGFEFNPAITRRIANFEAMKAYYKKRKNLNFDRKTDLRLFTVAAGFRKQKAKLPKEIVKGLNQMKFKWK